MAGLISRLLARVTKPEKPGLRLYSFGNSVAGVRLNDPQEVLKLAAAWRCVNLVSQTVAMLPWQIFKRDADGQGERQKGNSVEWLLGHESNEEMTAFDFKQTLVQHTMLHGNGYAEIERDARGRPTSLHLLAPDRVEPGRLDDGRLAYSVRQAGGDRVILGPRDIFHLKGLSFDGLRGYSVLEVGARSLGVGMAMDEFSARYFSNGMRPAGFVKTKGKLNADGLKTFNEMMAAHWTGLKNFHKAIPLDADMEWEPMGSNLDEAQFVDMRKLSVVEVCRLFGVPPHMVYDLERSTNNNIESQGRDFLTYGLLPRIIPMEQEADRKLLTSGWGGLYSKMNVNALVRGDMAARGAYYQQMRNMGVFTVNDILRLEDMNTIGKDGDVRVMQMQYQPTDKPADPNADKPADPNADPDQAGDTPPAEAPKPKPKRKSAS